MRRGSWARRTACDLGQSTVEFAVVAAVFLTMSMGLWAIAGYMSQGAVVDDASDSAAYSIGLSERAIRYALMF